MRELRLRKLQPSYFGEVEKKAEPKGNAPKPSTTDGKPEQVAKQNGKK
jgi:hypothetical protein